MIVLAGIVCVTLAAMTLIAFINLLFADRLEDAPPPPDMPAVSVLLPVRNEERNLAENLPGLLALDYPRLEILVLDDASTDGSVTEARTRIADSAAQSAGSAARRVGDQIARGSVLAEPSVATAPADDVPRARLIIGDPLPPGWLGKNWACHQLAREASGEILLFCDADVSVTADAVTRTVGTMRSRDVGALTAFPRQRLSSWYSAAVVPLVAQLPVAALVPLPLLSRVSAPSLAVGNGQWLAFTRVAYDRSGGHEAVRAEVVEDVALIRAARRAGARTTAIVSQRATSVRMYSRFAEMREGFEKNLHALGGGPWGFPVVWSLFLFLAIYPWSGALAGFPGAGFALALLAVLRVCVAITFRHDWRSIALHPVGSVLVAWIGLRSWCGAKRGTLVWKGRSLALNGLQRHLGANRHSDTRACR